MILTIDEVEGIYREGWDTGAAVAATDAWNDSTARAMYAKAGTLGPVPPFPQEPAFGSPEAVERAAETIRFAAQIQQQPRPEVRERLEALRRGSHPDSANGQLYIEASQLLAEVEGLREELETARIHLQEQVSETKGATEEWRVAAEQRGALADLLAVLRRLLPRNYQAGARREYRMEPLSGNEIETIDELLRKAGR